jgi:hypothetical protein
MNGAAIFKVYLLRFKILKKYFIIYDDLLSNFEWPLLFPY